MLLVNVFLPLIAVASCLLLALIAASRLLRESSLAVWLAGTMCLFYGIFTWGFQVLALVHGFSRVLVVPTFVVAPLILVFWCRHEITFVVEALREDLAREMTALAKGLRLHPVVLVSIAAIAAHVIVRLARALATPAFGWDDFTYHLFRAGRWVQNAGITLEPAPDAWTYYEFFPWGGDLIWAWALVWRVGDVLVAAAAVGIWVACLLMAYALARRCDQQPLPSLLVAIALTVLPSQLAQVATAYVDNVQLMLVLASSVLLLEFLRFGQAESTETSGPRRSGAAFVLGVGCGLGMLVKLSFLPLFGLIALTIAWTAARRKQFPELVAFVLGTTILIPNVAFTWYHRGSPFYPFRVIEFLPFNAQLSQVLSQLDPADVWHRVPVALKALILNARADDPFLNIGFTGIVLLVLGSAGAMQLWQQRSSGRPYLICVVVSAVVAVAQLASPTNSSMLTTWAPVLGRLIVPSFAAIMVLAGRFPAGLQFVLMPVLVTEYFLYAPWRWPRQVLLATGVVLFAFAVVAGAAVILARWRVRPAVRWSALAAVVVASLSVTAAVHDRVRYGSYMLFASRQLDDFHGAGRVGAWPIWLRLDEKGPSRVAMAAGWDGVGHNWFRYGLLGARLQHDVR